MTGSDSTPVVPNSPQRPRTRKFRWWIWGGFLVSPVLASWYGVWLNTDSNPIPGPVAALMPLGGYHRYELAADWLQHARCQSIWIGSNSNDSLVKLGISRPGSEVSREQLLKLGVPANQIHTFEIDVADGDLPGEIRAIGHQCVLQNAPHIVITCQTLEVRSLRQIANGALDPEVRSRIHFLPMPNDRYRAAWWWLSRTGMKDVANQTLQVLSNWWDGPTGGFDQLEWHPETWEPPRAAPVP